VPALVGVAARVSNPHSRRAISLDLWIVVVFRSAYGVSINGCGPLEARNLTGAGAARRSEPSRRCEMLLTDHSVELLMLSGSLITALVLLFGFGGKL
jgi:hypothetical protein